MFRKIAGAFAFVLATAGPAAAQTLDTLKVGYVPVAEVAPVFIGMQKGFFAKEGIKLEMSPGAGGPAMIAGVISGTTNVAISAVVPLIQARASGLPVVALSSARTIPAAGDDDGLMVRSDSGLNAAKDLEGKVIAVIGRRSINEVAIRAAVDKLGGQSEALKFIEMPLPDMITMLEAKRVDAIAVPEPFYSGAIRRGNKMVFNYMKTAAGRRPVTVWFSSEPQIAANPKLFERFERALNKAKTFASENPEAVREIIPTYTRLTAGQVEAITIPDLNAPLVADDFKFYADLMLRYKFLNSAPDLSKIVR